MDFSNINADDLLNLSILVIGILLVILLFVILTRSKRKTKRAQKVISSPVDAFYLETLVHALGNKNNIKSLSSEHQRLKVIVNDIKAVDSKKLSELSIPTFLKGKELTLLIKNHTKEVLSYLNDKIKEEN